MEEGHVHISLDATKEIPESNESDKKEINSRPKGSEAGVFKKYGTQLLGTFFATTADFDVGNVLGWASPAIPDIINGSSRRISNLTTSDIGWVSSIATLGAAVAALLTGVLIDLFGRKGTIRLLAPISFIGWIFLSYSKNFTMLILGRLITASMFIGFCAGAYASACTIFIGEISSPSIRGMLGNTLTISVIAGILFIYLCGAILSWDYCSLMCAIFPMITLSTSFLIYESPRNYVRMGQMEKAREALKFYCPCFQSSDIEELLEKIDESVLESKNERINLRGFFRKSVQIPLAISIALMAIQQLSGINAVLFNTVQIFQKVHSTVPDIWAASIVATVQFFMSLLATITMDLLGRKVLLIISLSGCVICLIALGAYFSDSNVSVKWSFLPLVSFVVYISFNIIGLGPIPWLMMAELLPTQVRGIATSLTAASNWFLSFIILITFQTLNDVWGLYVLFWGYAIFSFAGIFFILFFVPETRGKSLEEIQSFFTN